LRLWLSWYFYRRACSLAFYLRALFIHILWVKRQPQGIQIRSTKRQPNPTIRRATDPSKQFHILVVRRVGGKFGWVRSLSFSNSPCRKLRSPPPALI
jgi:hypothetical protein